MRMLSIYKALVIEESQRNKRNNAITGWLMMLREEG
jgi:hypothetical protein